MINIGKNVLTLHRQTNLKKCKVMKTINESNFRKLNAQEMNEVKGGYFVIIVTPDGRRYKIWV